jgi:hypothetical protein
MSPICLTFLGMAPSKTSLAHLSLEQKADEMTLCEFECLVGFVMDNTKTNWRAMLVLEEKYLTIANRGCLAHSLSLMLKAFCKHVPGQGRNAGKSTQGMQWAQGVVEWANKLANSIQDSTDAKSLVRGKQLAVATCTLSRVSHCGAA